MKPSLRIAFIVPGGIDRRKKTQLIPTLLSFIERLARRHTVHVFALSQYSHPTTYRLFGATVHSLAEKEAYQREIEVYGLKRWVLWREIMDVARKEGAWDLVHAFWGGTSGWLAAMEAHRLDIPSVVSLAGDELAALPDIQYGAQLNSATRREVSETLKLATRLTVSTTYMHRVVKAHRHESSIVPLGLDKSCFSPKSSPFFTRTPSPATPWRLLHVGSLSLINDLTTLLNAFRVVVNQINHIQLDIVGIDTLQGMIQTQVAELGLTQHVTFHHSLRPSHTRYFFEKADLFLLSARHVTISTTLLEAAAHMVPIIGTNVSYVADWAGSRAIAVSIGDAEALAGAVITLLQHPQQRQMLARAAYQWARRHDADWTSKQFESIYRDLIDRFRAN